MTDESPIHFKAARSGTKKLCLGLPPAPKTPLPPPRVPRIARLMALAIHFNGLIRQGVARDYSDLARLGGVAFSRITQIMNLLNLAPEIQERLLFMETTSNGRDPVTEFALRSVAETPDWTRQRRMFAPYIQGGRGKPEFGQI